MPFKHFPRATGFSADDVRQRLTEAGVKAVYEALGVEEFKSGGPGNWLVCSPLRTEEKPSFSIRRIDGVWKDHGTDEAGDIFEAVMRKRNDDFGAALEFVATIIGMPHTETTRQNGSTPRQRRIVATYDYHDADGSLLYQVVRYEPKDFSQRHPDGKGGWLWNLNGVQRVPYRLPELLAEQHRVAFIVEGEKDADRLASLGLVATTNMGGAKKWQSSYSAYLKGRRVVILPDNDKGGREHAHQVAQSLYGIAAEVRIVTLPNVGNKGDISDFLDAGGTLDDLRQLCNEA